MGKAALLLVLSSFMAISLSYVTKDRSKYNKALTEADYEEKILARETAQSAYNIISSKVKNDFDGYRGSVADRSLATGEYDYSATEEADGSVTITAKGKLGNHEYEITGTITRCCRVLDALTVDGVVDEVDANNAYLISGNNTKPDGNDDVGIDVHAILSTTQTAYDLLIQELNSEQVTGADGDMDIIMAEPEINLGLLGDAIWNYSGDKRIFYKKKQKFDNGEVFGSSTDPVVMIVDGKLEMKGTSRGYGVLYVAGDVKFSNSARWDGLIYAIKNGGKHKWINTSSVYGAVILRSTANGSFSGNTGANTSDRGLIGGHFDIDVFDGISVNKIYHEHQYDDKYDLTGVDVLSFGCKHGGLCWDTVIGDSGYNNYAIEFFNEDYGDGTYRVQVGSTEYTGSTEAGFAIQDVLLEDISVFEAEFTDLCLLRTSSPKDVQSDATNRNSAFTIRVFGYNGTYNPVSATLVYELSVYHHTKNNSTTCSENADPDTDEKTGKAMEIELSNFAKIVYSQSTLSILKSLISELDVSMNEFKARKTSELPKRKANALLKYR